MVLTFGFVVTLNSFTKICNTSNDASAAGERIQAEAYYQHADHYFRVHSAILVASEERRERHQEQKNSSDQSEATAEEVVQEDVANEIEAIVEQETAQEENSQKVRKTSKSLFSFNSKS